MSTVEILVVLLMMFLGIVMLLFPGFLFTVGLQFYKSIGLKVSVANKRYYTLTRIAGLLIIFLSIFVFFVLQKYYSPASNNSNPASYPLITPAPLTPEK